MRTLATLRLGDTARGPTPRYPPRPAATSSAQKGPRRRQGRTARRRGASAKWRLQVVADLRPIRRSIGFRRLDGIVGSDLLLRYAIEVNTDRRLFALWRHTYPVPVEARRVQYTVRQNFITIPALIDSVAGSVILDTGNRSSLTLFRPFARDHGFYSIEPSVRGAVTGYGIGGPILADIFRTQLAAFGYTVNGVLTRAAVGPGGAFDTSSGAGSIGNGFMLRFNVVYDLPHQTLVLWPSRRFATEERYDPVGMWIAVGPGGPIVTSVLHCGSADRAGVRVGDTVLAANGLSTKAWFPPRLRDWLAARPTGTRVMLLVQPRAGTIGVRNVLIQPPV
jgi:PDZ domain